MFISVVYNKLLNMTKKVQTSVSLTPELKDLLRHLKETNEIKSVSGAIRELVEGKYGKRHKITEAQKKITEFK